MPVPEHGLTPRQIAAIKAILAPFADRIERVSLFGSRAKGTQRPDSDIDLVIYGPVDQGLIDRLWTLFAESSLPVKVDVVAYDRATYPPLKAHIDGVARPLLSQSDLRSPEPAA